MDRFDYKKDLKELYFPPSKHPVTVEVPAMNFLMTDGEGDPNTSQAFREAVEALYGASYTVKFMLKKQGRGADYGVPPLEDLKLRGQHHEIYLSDFRRTDPAKLKTVLRHPVT